MAYYSNMKRIQYLVKKLSQATLGEKMRTKLNIFITVVVFIVIFFYHLSNILISTSNQDLATLYKIVQFSIIISAILFLLYNKFIQKIILGKEYIEGNYGGTSKYFIPDNIKPTNEELEKENTIEFSISQTISEIKIHGQSAGKNKDIRSSWVGSSFSKEGSSYYFALQLDTVTTEFGILKLTFNEESAVGFYYSGEPNSKYTYTVSAKKIKKA